MRTHVPGVRSGTPLHGRQSSKDKAMRKWVLNAPLYSGRRPRKLYNDVEAPRGGGVPVRAGRSALEGARE
jgi:hypothetical protein